MSSHVVKILLAALTSLTLSESAALPSSAAPTVRLPLGTYQGLRNEHYAQDEFLGIPYAQPPVGPLRFASPKPITKKFDKVQTATEYGLMCIGYGSDTQSLGNPVSEDCLSINVVRPAGVKAGDNLPVGVWVHGGSYVNGGSRDPRYNLSYIVEQSVKENKPIIAASINYRVSYWGFMFSNEMEEAGAGNLGLKDQRLALEWLQNNIGAFGGSPQKGHHLGRNLFRSAILESGSPVAKFADADAWRPYFDALVKKTGCTNETARLECLRELPWQTLNDIFNGTNPLGVTSPSFSAVVDGDFMTTQGSKLLKEGKFAHVPVLIGNNFDEGTAYVKQGINTDSQWEAWLTSLGMSANQIASLSTLYPDDPAVGIPSSQIGRPAASPWGLQYKRASAFAGDYQQHSGRRLLVESSRRRQPPREVAFVFNNIHGVGYATNPFEGKPETFVELADLMSKMWVSFIHGTDPNVSGGNSTLAWPKYTLDKPDNYVFDVNHTALAYLEKDDYREAPIDYLLQSVFA
ncbi:hypothetical protein NW754_001620 [Fusarium falciforme]|nr:hypothetical protein NW754_001620 [Fusarium falciforme]